MNIKLKEILECALLAFKAETGFEFEVIDCDFSAEDLPYMNLKGTGFSFRVFIKTSINKNNINAIIHQIKQTEQDSLGVVVTEYINPHLAEILKQESIQFIDTVGNAFIRTGGLYVFVQGKKPKQLLSKPKIGRAFQLAGLKVVFAILQNPALLDLTYRDIAEQSGVSLGGVGAILRDLVAQGYLVEVTAKRYRLLEKKPLLARWVENYPNLQRRGLIGTFTTEDSAWFQKLSLSDLKATIGGEIAAEQLMHYLQAKDGIVYLPKRLLAEFIKTARLKRRISDSDVLIRIDIYEPFWIESAVTEKFKPFAPPIIIYADLISNGDPRNRETAERLYEQLIQNCN